MQGVLAVSAAEDLKERSNIVGPREYEIWDEPGIGEKTGFNPFPRHGKNPNEVFIKKKGKKK